MSLLGEISDVHDGVLSPRVAGTYHDTAQAMLHGANTIGIRHGIDSHEKMRREALQVAIAAVQCRQLASGGMEKERGDVHLCDDLSGLTNAEDAKKANDALKQLNGECDYVEEVKCIIAKVNHLPSCAPIETRTVHLKVCGVDGGECNFKYRRYPSWHIMGEFDMEVSECRLSGIPKSYPTHLKHCEHTR